MKKISDLNNFLGGPWSPWKPEGPENMRRDLSQEQGLAQKIQEGRERMLLNANLAAPYNRESKMYQEQIEWALLQAHWKRVEEISGLSDLQEQLRQFNQYYRQLKELLERIPELRDLFAEGPEEESDAQGGSPEKGGNDKQVTLSRFVLESLTLLLVNCLQDSNLRFEHIAPQEKADDIYLEVLDQQAPDPPPFLFTLQWHRQQLHYLLHQAALRFDLDLEELVIQHLARLGKRLKGLEPESPEWHAIHNLKRHVKNGILLIMLDVGFLKREPEAIMDCQRCREWVRGEKVEMIQKMNNGDRDLIPAMEKIHEVMIQFSEFFEPVRDRFANTRRSAAALWMEEMLVAGRIGSEVPTPAGVVAGGGAVITSESFVQAFRQKFVHASELEEALGVDKKTVRSYLEKGHVPTLVLNANKWYRRDELDRFFDDHTE